MPGNQDWLTPLWLYDELNVVMTKVSDKPFKLDAAASCDTALCTAFSSDGLNVPWQDSTFCNPPFAKFGKWMEKAFFEALDGDIHSCIIGPVGCSQSWFHNFATHATILVPGRRISFIDPVTGKPKKSGADRDTMIFMFGPSWSEPQKVTWNLVPF